MLCPWVLSAAALPLAHYSTRSLFEKENAFPVRGVGGTDVYDVALRILGICFSLRSLRWGVFFAMFFLWLAFLATPDIA